MVSLSLGAVVFQGFEIPERIGFGGEQQIVVHKLPGGGRVIDSLGPDNKDLSWSGRFRGESASSRARLLDYMRVQGQQILLAWDTFRYQVVIKSYEADFEQTYEIPYRISCTVVVDEAMAIANAVVGFLDAIATDVLNAVGLSASVPAINTAVTGVAGALTNLKAGVPTSTNALALGASVAEAPLFSALQSSIGTAQTATQSNIASTGAAISTTGSVAGVTSGGSVSSLASGLLSQASAFLQLNNLYQISSTLSRMATNVTNAQANGSTVLH